MKYAYMLTLPKERGDVRTLLVIRVRYQARSEVRTLLVFNTQFNHKRKDSEVDLRKIQELISAILRLYQLCSIDQARVELLCVADMSRDEHA
jgi:hypothetical protein